MEASLASPSTLFDSEDLLIFALLNAEICRALQSHSYKMPQVLWPKKDQIVQLPTPSPTDLHHEAHVSICERSGVIQKLLPCLPEDLEEEEPHESDAEALWKQMLWKHVPLCFL